MPYQRADIRAPRLAGAMLKMVAPLAESSVTGALIRRQMLAEAGIPAMHNLALTQAPSVAPDLPRCGTLDAGAAGVLVLEGEPEPANTEGYQFETADAFAAAYRAGTTTPMEVAERLLTAVDQSERYETPFRFLIAQQAEDVRTQARASQARWKEGKPRGPLDGVPVAIKDELDMLPYGTSAGTSFAANVRVKADATVVARLRKAGALLMGKANMHEFGMGVTGVNPHHGAVRNPYDPRCFTGGSSSGSAALVAAGLCPVAVGADGGGSIRIPAGLCGVVGLKATFGRISEHGAAPLCWSVGHVGPLGATARDVAQAYAVMAGEDAEDPRTLGQPAPTLHDFTDPDLSDLRLGVYSAWFDDADPDVVAACRAALEQFKLRGAHVVEIEIPNLAEIRVAHLVTIVSEMAVGRQAHFAGARDAYGADTRLNMCLAEALTARDYVQAQRIRTLAVQDVLAVLKDVDGIVTPATACTAQPIAADGLKGESNLAQTDRIMRFAQLANLTGLPGVSFPVGYDARGLPVGMQVMGRPWDEALLLRVAHAAEEFVPRKAPRWHRRLLATV